MASRNERKRRAKARCEELKLAVADALAKEEVRQYNLANPVPNLSQMKRSVRDISGKVSRGKVISVLPSEVKRKLTFDPVQGRMIERSIRPSGLKTPRRTIKVK